MSSFTTPIELCLVKRTAPLERSDCLSSLFKSLAVLASEKHSLDPIALLGNARLNSPLHSSYSVPVDDGDREEQQLVPVLERAFEPVGGKHDRPVEGLGPEHRGDGPLGEGDERALERDPDRKRLCNKRRSSRSHAVPGLAGSKQGCFTQDRTWPARKRIRSSTIAVISSLCSWDTGLFNQRNTQQSFQKVSIRQAVSTWHSQYSLSTKSPASHWRC